jgi:malto-oligosyltrehalose trehalohydrolase
MAEYAWGPRIGADGTRFRLWAPGVEALELLCSDRAWPMEEAGDGWWQVDAPAAPGKTYAFRLPSGLTVPDPAARAQAGDVHGPSRLVEPRHDWRHESPRRPWEEAVICEIHVGTFTPEGTFRAAIEKMPLLAEAGYTGIDILPVAQFGGRRGWGYDGVLLYAPHEAYGTPDDLRALVDAAHGAGLMVQMDVVYNHFGPDGNYLGTYAPGFFDETRHTPWGSGIRYDAAPVRRFFIENALYWLREFRIDGLRFDAIDHVRDPSEPEILVEMARAIRVEHPGAWLMTEDNRNVTHLHEREDGRAVLMSGEWNDDWHNAAHVVATGEVEGYYADFADDPVSHLARAAAEGFAYQGQQGPASDAPRGRPSGHLPPAAFVDFLQNHDQIGNRALGERLTELAPRPRLLALQAMLLLSPHVPLTFQGDEWGETGPFLFFADFEGELGQAVSKGRREEFAHFMGFAGAVPDPIDPETFERSKLRWERRDAAGHREALERFRALADLRRSHVVPLLAGTGPGCGTRLEAPAGCVAVDWRLNGGLLQCRANLGPDPGTLPATRGETIHLTGAAPGAPESCLFALARDDRP